MDYDTVPFVVLPSNGFPMVLYKGACDAEEVVPDVEVGYPSELV